MRQQMVLMKKKLRMMEVTVFQSPEFREMKGYKPVCTLQLEAKDHYSVLEKTFRMFSVQDTFPENCSARFIRTGDIVSVSEEHKELAYYRLHSGGWKKISRIHVR
ncbi:hypothetical protein GKZ89_01240 [Bacillus mangrovi]|uniref:YodL-like protein n=1 Tax=Metabacillus mangrovi TaxID=1491830 RepID=A0A7X2S1C2_9BACI|nr:hypothetical protein [Metabacillus mangrovi]MTH52014.1 hypothetical protein [Metabacillus mangrovi]